MRAALVAVLLLAGCAAPATRHARTERLVRVFPHPQSPPCVALQSITSCRTPCVSGGCCSQVDPCSDDNPTACLE